MKGIIQHQKHYVKAKEKHTNKEMHSKVGDALLLDTNQVGFLSRGVGFTVGTEGGHMGHGSHGGGTHPWQAEERAHKRQQTHDELVHVEPRAFLKLAFLLVQNHSGQNRQPLGYFLSLQYSLSAPLVCFFQLCVCVWGGGVGGLNGIQQSCIRSKHI